MTFLYRTKAGIYYYRKTFITASGKRSEIKKSLKTADRKLAQYLALKLFFDIPSDTQIVGVISNQKTGELVGAITKPNTSKASKLNVSDAVTQFLAEKARTGYWTEKEYGRGANMLEALAELLGDSSVSDICRKDAAAFKDALLKTSKSVTTVNNYLKRGAMLFDWLLDRGDVTGNPFRGVGIKQRRGVATLRNAWSSTEKKVFLQFANEQQEWRKWILLILRYTGARPGEICQLYKDDIDLKAKTLAIQATRPDQSLKTPSSNRILPIHSHLIKAGFLQYVEACTTPRLFPQLNRTRDNYSQTFTTWYSKQKDETPLPGLYGARHTAATEMKNAGIPNQYASAVLGHANNSITYDRYGKGVESDRLRKAVEVIGK